MVERRRKLKPMRRKQVDSTWIRPLSDRKHRCRANDCQDQIPIRLLMCKKHWFMVPKRIRDTIWETWKPGLEIQVDAYYRACKLAVCTVAVMEGRMTQEQADAAITAHSSLFGDPLRPLVSDSGSQPESLPEDRQE